MPDQERYAVLEVSTAGFRSTKGGVVSVRSSPASLTFHNLGRQEVMEYARQPHVTVAPIAMSMQLIRPATLMEAAPLAAAGIAGWGLRAVGAHRCPYSGAGVTIAVLDTGIDKSHAAFTGMDLKVRDFTGEGDHDHSGHGTHCAATIFGRDVDGQRIGVAPGVKRALIGKVLDRRGSGTLEAILDGILWGVGGGADVISLSIGVDFPGYVSRLMGQGLPPEVATSRALVDYRATVRLFDRLRAFIDARTAIDGRDVILVAAAGNESQRDVDPSWTVTTSPPANAEGLIAVAAVKRATEGEYAVANFSNTWPTLSAPGVDIVSAAAGDGLVGMSGTSMAAPHVAGVAALWLERQKSRGGAAARRSIRATLLDRARHLADLAEEDVGVGLVQAPANEE